MSLSQNLTSLPGKNSQNFHVDFIRTLTPAQQVRYLEFFQNSVQSPMLSSLKARIAQMLRDPHSMFINITHGNELIALAAVSQCIEGGMFAHFYEKSETTLAFTMAAICKKWRGRDLYRMLNEARFDILNSYGCTQLLTHTQNSCVLRGLMHSISESYPKSRRMPLELIPGMYGCDISGKKSITASDVRDWGSIDVLFHPQQGDAFRLRWKLL